MVEKVSVDRVDKDMMAVDCYHWRGWLVIYQGGMFDVALVELPVLEEEWYDSLDDFDPIRHLKIDFLLCRLLDALAFIWQSIEFHTMFMQLQHWTLDNLTLQQLIKVWVEI